MRVKSPCPDGAAAGAADAVGDAVGVLAITSAAGVENIPEAAGDTLGAAGATIGGVIGEGGADGGFSLSV
jgi:hypothetical protein